MNTLTIVAAAILAMTANAAPVSPTLLEFVALPVKKSAASFAEAAAARAVVEEVFPSPAAEPETQAVEDLFSSWETISQHRQLQQANDCDDPSGGCVADSPGYWCGYWLECSPKYMYTFQCRGWYCGWCSSNGMRRRCVRPTARSTATAAAPFPQSWRTHSAGPRR